MLVTSGAFQLLPLRAAGPSPSTRVVAAAWPMLVTATFVSSAYATVPSRNDTVLRISSYSGPWASTWQWAVAYVAYVGPARQRR